MQLGEVGVCEWRRMQAGKVNQRRCEMLCWLGKREWMRKRTGRIRQEEGS